MLINRGKLPQLLIISQHVVAFTISQLLIINQHVAFIISQLLIINQHVIVFTSESVINWTLVNVSRSPKHTFIDNEMKSEGMEIVFLHA